MKSDDMIYGQPPAMTPTTFRAYRNQLGAEAFSSVMGLEESTVRKKIAGRLLITERDILAIEGLIALGTLTRIEG